MTLNKGNWEETQLGKVVQELRNSSSNPINDGYDKYIGFEHIEPENLYLNRLGDLNDGVTFVRSFKKGDVLFGKIRAYLKKVAVAPIDGICSGDILVLRTKDEEKLSQVLLPYYLTTKSFLKRAIDTSSGTTLPRTKWQHLTKHIIALPTLKEQKQIAALFQSIENAIGETGGQEIRLKNLALKIIEDLTSDDPKLGNVLTANNLIKTKLGEIAYEYSKREDNPKGSKYDRYIGSDSIDRFDFKIEKWQSNKSVISAMKVFEPNDYLLVRRSLYASDFRERAPRADFGGLCSGDILTIKENNSVISDGYLLIVLNSPRLWAFIVANGSGSITRRIKWKELSTFEISIPDYESQKKIVQLFDQIQNAMQLLKQQKSSLKNLKQHLLNEILG